MANGSSDTPDASVLADIRRIIAAPKTWVATGEMEWVDAGGRPRGFRLIERLALPDGSQPAGLFVAAYFKPAMVPGARDKLSIGLHARNMRVFAIDENGPSGHFNHVGIGRPYFLQRVGFPHVHTVSDDSIEGYAEPIHPMTFEQYWEHFVKSAGIQDAPSFGLPAIQLGLSV